MIELMIALTCGGIAISSMYAIGSASIRTFRAQDRIATTQSSLRSAMAQVKRDFQRAGFQGTPNIDLPGERCTPPVGPPLNSTVVGYKNGRLAAISAYRQKVDATEGGFEDLDPKPLNTWNRIDDVILTGNYSTSGEYMGVLVVGAGKGLTVPYSTQGFARDFTHWYDVSGSERAGDCNVGALQTAFTKGRLVRVHTLSDLNAFLPIESAICDSVNNVAQINLTETVPSSCNATSGWLSPLNTIRYWVKNAGGTAASRAGNRIAVLHRTEVDPNKKEEALVVDQLGGGSRVVDDRMVLDYVVHFRVDFLLRGNNLNTVNFVPATQDEVAKNPERVRGAIIELGARTAEHEPDMDAKLLKTSFPPFRVYDTRGAARTRVLKAELLLPNLANEGL
jgi:hypothetical protein